MSIFRVIAVIAFLVAAILTAINSTFEDPIFWVSAGLAALAVSGASFDRNVG